MPRMIKYAIAPETGALVYRSNGRMVQGRFEIRDNRVYRDGRLSGYIGKGTKKEQRNIAEIDHRNRADRRRSLRRRETLRKLETQETLYQSLGAVLYEQAPGGYIRPTHILSRRELTEINYAHLLNEAVKDGKMTRQEAADRYERYINTEGSKERSEQWDELKGRFEELGFEYP